MKTIKTIALILFLAQYPFLVEAQKIQYKNTSIEITNDGGFGTIQNNIRYEITASLIDADTLASLFADKQFQLKDGKLYYSSLVQVSNMWDIIKYQAKTEQSDVGLYAYNIIVKWSTNMIYQMNLLELKNINDWKIK